MFSCAVRFIAACLFLLVFTLPAMAKVTSVLDGPGTYAGSINDKGFGGSRDQNSGNAPKLDTRCEKYSGYFSSVPANQDCDEAFPLPKLRCYKNCRCAYGLSADCTCNASRFFARGAFPSGTETTGETCTTKSQRQSYFALRCKPGFKPVVGTNRCVCAYGEDKECLCNSKEYPLSVAAPFDTERYDYAKCPAGEFYKISACKILGYQLVGGKCILQCAQGYVPNLPFCAEDLLMTEQADAPHCRRCEPKGCPEPYTFSRNCVDGTVVAEHPSQSGCYKCEGTPCRDPYATNKICQSGENKVFQEDNRQCFTCEGKTCQEGYQPYALCSDGQTTLRQSDNPICQKCSGIACESSYRLDVFCRDGQTLQTQKSNPSCQQCLSQPCLAGYSTKTETCASGETLRYQSNNAACKRCS